MIDLILSFFAPLFFLVLLTVFFIYLFGKKLRFEQVLPIALMSLVLFVYAVILVMHNLSVAFWLSVVATVVASGVYLFKDDKRLVTLKSLLLTPGLVVFCVLYVFLYILNFDRQAAQWDEYIHWMPFVKDMLRTNDFYTSPHNAAYVVHGDYPPAIPLLETIWCKLSGGYKESYLYNALQVLCVSMVWPIFAKLTWGKRGTYLKSISLAGLMLVSLVSLLLFVNLYDGTLDQQFTFFTSVYIDATIASLFAYGVWLVFSNEKMTASFLIRLSIIVTFLLLAKDIGDFFAGIIVLYWLFDQYMDRKASWNWDNVVKQLTVLRQDRKRIAVGVIAVLIPVICWFGWSIQKDGFISRGGFAQFNAGNIKPLEDVPVLFHKYGSNAQQTSARNFVSHIFSSPVPINTDLFKVTYWQATILLTVATITILYANRRRINTRKSIALVVVLVAGWVSYIVLIFNLYLFGGFSDGEQIILASSDRYLGTYLFTWVLLVGMTGLYGLNFSPSRIRSKQIIVFMAILGIAWGLFFNKSAYDSLVPYKLQSTFSVSNISSFLPPLEKSVNTIKGDHSYSSNHEAVILLTCHNGATFEEEYFRYQFLPVKLVTSNTLQDLGLWVTSNSTYSDKDMKNIEELLRNYKPVYLIPLCDAGMIQKLTAGNTRVDTSKPIEKYQALKYSVVDHSFEPIN